MFKTQIALGSLIIRKRRLQYLQASFLFGTPYQVQCIKSEDKYKELRSQIIELFAEAKGRYGYRRIHCLLKRNGIIVSEKVVRRIMSDEQLVVKKTKKRKLSF